MLISVEALKKYWGVNPKSIVHVGAHNAEELIAYAKAGWGPVTWIEAQPEKVQELSKKIPDNHKLIEAAVWDVDELDLNLNVMTNTESTSLLELGTHASEHPTVTFSHKIPVKTKTLQTLLVNQSPPDLLALDIQGVELRAIKGYGSSVSQVKWIYCEVNKAELYEGCSLITEIDEYLAPLGLIRAVTRWTIHDWGDALYVNTDLVSKQSLIRRFFRLHLYAKWKIRDVLVRYKAIVWQLFK